MKIAQYNRINNTDASFIHRSYRFELISSKKISAVKEVNKHKNFLDHMPLISMYVNGGTLKAVEILDTQKLLPYLLESHNINAFANMGLVTLEKWHMNLLFTNTEITCANDLGFISTLLLEPKSMGKMDWNLIYNIMNKDPKIKPIDTIVSKATDVTDHINKNRKYPDFIERYNDPGKVTSIAPNVFTVFNGELHIQKKGLFLRPLEETKLAKEKDKGNRAAFDALIIANRPLVTYVIEKYFYGYKEDQSDMISAGNEGLMRAAECYSGNYRFATYATYWIRSMIERALNADKAAISLDEEIGNEGSGNRYDLIADDKEHIEDDVVIATLNKQGIELITKIFNSSKLAGNKDFLEIFLYRLNGKHFKEIGDEFGLSKERIRQICAKIWHILNHNEEYIEFKRSAMTDHEK